MGPEGFEPPPTGLKGRHAAATPRPRVGRSLPEYSFDPCHHISLSEFLIRKSGRPDSNRRSQAPEACGLARLSHALVILASGPCGNRTHLSALKGRYPEPIDERASFLEWAGGRSNPRLSGVNLR